MHQVSGIGTKGAGDWYDRENQRKQIADAAPSDRGSLFFPESDCAFDGTCADGDSVRNHIRLFSPENAEKA